MYNKFKKFELLENEGSIMATIGSRIKTLREAHKLTQSEFGELFGIVKSTVSSYEHGNSTPDDSIKVAICNYFDISMDYLVGLTDATHTVSPRFSGFLFQYEFSQEFESLQNKINDIGIDFIEKETNISKEKLSAIMDKNNSVQPTISELIAIANACNCSLDELLGKTDKKNKAIPEGQPLTDEQEALLNYCSDLSNDDLEKVIDYIELLKLKNNAVQKASIKLVARSGEQTQIKTDTTTINELKEDTSSDY